MTLKKHLERLRKVERRKHHPLLHKIHKKHRISRKTLFYVKEYGPHSNIPKTIIRESIKVLLFASVVSSFGGLALEQIKLIFMSVIPLVILMPTLNDMVGDYGTIASSRFSTMLHEGEARCRGSAGLRRLFLQLFIISMITAAFSAFASLAIACASGHGFSMVVSLKVLAIAFVDVAVLVSLVFATSIKAGRHFFEKGEDPNNLLIPLTTSMADFANMLLLSVLVLVMF